MKIEVYRDNSGQYRWHRRSPSGVVTAQGEGHRRKWNAKRAAHKLFPEDQVIDLTRKGNLMERKPNKR